MLEILIIINPIHKDFVRYKLLPVLQMQVHAA